MSKLLAASEQLVELNEKLEVQKVAVTEKTEACETLLEEITTKTNQANEKKRMAVGKKSEIAEEKVKIAKEKVRNYAVVSSNVHKICEILQKRRDMIFVKFSTIVNLNRRS